MGSIYSIPVSKSAVTRWLYAAQEDERPMTHQESQTKWLQDASNLVKRNAFFMKRALVHLQTFLHPLGDIVNLLEVWVHHQLGLHCAG
jgi:hypothetical protein